ncbi:response regulator [Chloroflexota bacterium]
MQTSAGGTKRILVVEDEPAISQICRRILTRDGFEVDTAINGEVAQEMLGERDYTLVLMDIRMPVMSGKEFYQILESQYPQLVDRVIIATGDVIGGETANFLEKSGRPFLPKPFTPDELKTIVRETLTQAEK